MLGRITASFVALMLGLAPATAQSVTILIRQGDLVNGGPSAFVSEAGMSINSSGQWICSASTGSFSSSLITSVGVGLDSGDVFPVPGFPDATISSFSSLPYINAAGRYVTSINLAGTGLNLNNRKFLFFDNVVVLQAGDDSSVLTGGTPGSPWYGTSWRFLLNDLNQVLVSGGINDPAVGTTSGDSILVRYELDSNGIPLSTTLVALQGDLLTGMAPGAGLEFDGVIDMDFNNNGDSILVVDKVPGGVTSPASVYTWVSGSFVLVADSGAIANFDPMRRSQSFSHVTINDLGVYAIAEYTVDAITGSDGKNMLVKNGSDVVASTGSSLPPIAPFSLSTLSTLDVPFPIQLDNRGRLLWGGTWNDPDTSRNKGLFVDEQLILQAGDLIGTDVITTIWGDRIGIAISPDGRYILAGCVLNATDEAVLLIDLGPEYVSICNGDGGDQMGCTNCPCSNNAAAQTIGGCLNTANRSGRLEVSGVPRVGVDSLRVVIAGGSSNTFAILSSGDTVAPTSVTNPCFGLNSGVLASTLDGLRCSVGGVQRHGARLMDANGDVGVTTSGWGPPYAPAGGLIAQGGFIAGQTRYFQAIYRDEVTLGCMTGLNSTQAVSVTFEP